VKRNPDPRYYLCPKRPCIGQVAPVLKDEQQRPVFLCNQCGRTFSMTTIDQEYRMRKHRGDDL
jgi:hypothetical protein